MKILYAANNHRSSALQLARIVAGIQSSNHQLKIAAYQISSPKNLNIDWSLNAMFDMYHPEMLQLHNDNLSIYFDQVKSYQPDLIISDLEYFTSYIANVLNIPIWQCSPSLIYHAFDYGYDQAPHFKKLFNSLIHQAKLIHERTKNIIANADRCLVYSHFGDTESSPNLYGQFEWVRPYHQLGQVSIPCRHHFTSAIFSKDVKFLEQVKNYQDGMVFMDQTYESYPNLIVKDINMQSEYYCNLKNSDFFVCQGEGEFLADAFYNGKYVFCYPNYQDINCTLNSQLTTKRGLGKMVSYLDDLTQLDVSTVKPTYRNNIKLLNGLLHGV